MVSDKLSIGQWIREFRSQQGLTQREVAEQAACAVITLQKFEADDRIPSLQLARRIAGVLLIDESEQAAFVELVAQTRKRQRQAVGASSEAPQLHKLAFDDHGTSFVGRERELHELLAAVRSEKYALISLVGSPGVGKTRLAYRFISELQSKYQTPIYMVALADVRTGTEFAARLVQQLMHQDEVSDDPWAALAEYAFVPRTLIVLDNIEQIEAVAEVVLRLVQLAPQCRFVLTSQHTLDVYGEYRIQLDPLALPPDHASVYQALQSPAIQVFVDRVNMYSDFELSESNLSGVLAVCRLLDGIPLALELAAYHFHLFTPDQFMQQLQEHQLRLLTSHTSRVESRHQTMLKTLDWSYSLLQPDQQIVLQAIALFPGPLTSHAVHALCFPDRPFLDVIRLLQSVLQTHMLVRHEQQHAVAYGLLNVVRSFLRDHTQPLVDPAVFEQRYVAFYQTFVQQALQSQDFGQLDQHYAGLLHCLELLDRFQSVDALAELVLRLLGFWRDYQRRYDGYLWLERVLGYEQQLAPQQKAQVLVALAHMALDVQQMQQASMALQAFFRLPQAQMDNDLYAQAWRLCGLLAQYQGRYAEAEQQFKRCLNCLKYTPNAATYIYALGNLAHVAALRHEYDLALALANECLLLAHYGPIQVESYLTIGTCYYRKPRYDYAEAKLSFDKALHLVAYMEPSHKVWEYQALIQFNLAYIAFLQHDVHAAQQYLYRSTSYQTLFVDAVLVYQTLMLWAAIWARYGTPVAQQMCASWANLLVRLGVPVDHVFVPDMATVSHASTSELLVEILNHVSLSEQLAELLQQMLELADTYAGSLVSSLELPSHVLRA